jgi:hypothetical protein
MRVDKGVAIKAGDKVLGEEEGFTASSNDRAPYRRL